MAVYPTTANILLRSESVLSMHLADRHLRFPRKLLNTDIDEAATVDVQGFLSERFHGELPARTAELSDLHLDSLDLVETLFELEQHTGRTLSNLELSSLSTLGDLIQFFSTPAQKPK